MNTEVVAVHSIVDDRETIVRAGQRLADGDLVAFPTETVYGLGTNAWNADAVQRIFTAKGRPNTNPVIVHVVDRAMVLNVVREWPETAERLSQEFWPGPLTLVLPRSPQVPDEVTAGGSTVAVRCPAHPVAQALLIAAGVPIAAPSANRSTELSPTRAEHVVQGLSGRIEMILDGGPCPGGIESTVVDLTGNQIRLLRPGLVSRAMLENVVGPITVSGPQSGPARSPGQMARHYSPRTRMQLVTPCRMAAVVQEFRSAGQKVGLLRFTQPPVSPSTSEGGDLDRVARTFDLGAEPKLASSRLYDALHVLDNAGLDMIVVAVPPDGDAWFAIRDRLIRAAAQSA